MGGWGGGASSRTYVYMQNSCFIISDEVRSGVWF